MRRLIGLLKGDLAIGPSPMMIMSSRFAKLPLSRPWLDKDDFIRVVQVSTELSSTTLSIVAEVTFPHVVHIQAIAMIKDESSSSESEASDGEISSA